MSWHVVNLRKLGDGGNGDVFLGERSDNGETVVVKFLRDYWIPDNRKWFAREIRILKQRIHQHLVSFLGGDDACARPYYIMPYLPGGSLTKWCGRLTHQQLTAAALQIAAPIAALHAKNIAHGDIKPDNVLLTAEGDLRVSDPLGNGAGCTVLYTVNSGGTPGYWAPEVSRGGPISKAGDAFSFGATLFHLATGRVPVDGQNLDPWLAGVATHRAIRDAILRATQRAPQTRATMAGIMRLLRGEAEAALAPSTDNGLPEWLKGLLILGGVVGGVALVATLAKSTK